MGIFAFLKKLFGSPTPPESSPQVLSRAAPSRPESSRPPRFLRCSTLSELQGQIRGKGHPQYPFLHQEYSPNSRIPCADFTPFIIERLRVNDLKSIGGLLAGIVEANPGLGTDGGWVNDELQQVVKAPLEKHIGFRDPDVYHQLRAMWIIAGKEGGDRGYWLIDRFPEYFALALSPYEMELKEPIYGLLKKANKFNREMRKMAVSWLDVPLIKPERLGIPPVRVNEGIEKVRGLTIGARLHLFFAVAAGGGCLPRLTDYELRQFGIFIPDTSKEIINSGLLSLSNDTELLKKTMNKNDLAVACDKAAISYKKSWNKDKLLQALSGSPAHLEALITEAQVVCLNPKHAGTLQALLTRAQQLEPVFRVLCFA